MAADHSSEHIVQSLVTNLIIAGAKGVAAFYTGSGALLAETLHTTADCGNQVLLLVGVRSAKRPATESHPLGYGRSVYFWSFMVALLLFTGGGVFSIYEGIHKLEHPEPVTLPYIGLAILVFSFALEGYATYSNVLEMNKRRASTPFFRYLRQTKDSDLVVVFAENAAACLGLVVAFITLLIAWVTGDSRFDAVGSAIIGVILVFVAIFLAVEVKSLLIGESADPAILAAVQSTIALFPEITHLLHAMTVQQGPGQVLLLLKLSFRDELSVVAVSDTINRFEAKLRELRPELRWCFIEPDVARVKH